MEIFDVYPLLDLEPVKAAGSYVFCNDGNRYLDFYGGHAVISIGHNHPHYVNQITEQLNDIGFYSNSVQNPLQRKLAAKLGELSNYENYQLFLCNSGAEAIENALKMASFHNGKSKVISFDNAFHGRTTSALNITDKDAYTAPINVSSEVVFLEMNNLKAVKEEISKGDICAVVLEPVQGIGGIRLFEDFFLQEVSKLCKEHNIVLICDEIQSGFGRTGKFFAHQHAGIRPDIITVAKGMGNGFPVAGTILSPEFEAEHGRLGSTFGGNHLACAAAMAVLQVIENEQLIQHAAQVGSQLLEALTNLPRIDEVRGRGLMIGLEFPYPIKELRHKLIAEEHIITGIASNPNVLRLLPPLTITDKEVADFTNAMENVLTEYQLQ